MKLKSSFGWLAVGVLAAAAMSAQACGPDTSTDPDGDGGESADGSGGTGGTSGTGGGSPDGGTSSGGNGSAEACDNGDNYENHVEEEISPNCTTSNVPNCNITDFSSETYFSDGTWGDDMSLTGETFEYAGDDSTLNYDVADEQLQMMASVGGDDYVGVGLSFGPCVDATDFDGIQVTVGGSIDEGGVFDLQLQTDENYPINDSDGIGSCEFEEEDNKWNVCTNNYFRLTGMTPEETITYYIPWTEFDGGTPVDTLSPNQLRGLQFQAGCDVDKAPCEIDLQVHDVRFYRDHDEYLGPEAMGGAGGAGGAGG